MTEQKYLIEKLESFAVMLDLMKQRITEITEMVRNTEFALDGVVGIDNDHCSDQFKELLVNCVKIKRKYSSASSDNHPNESEKIEEFLTICSKYKLDILPIPATAVTWMEESKIRTVGDLIKIARKSDISDIYGIGPVYRNMIMSSIKCLYMNADIPVDWELAK